jgi:hypothetical protein
MCVCVCVCVCVREDCVRMYARVVLQLPRCVIRVVKAKLRAK